jgi:hypothetical protein
MSTSDYYKKNPSARKKRNAQQTRYNKSGKGNAIAKRANRANRALGTYGNGDGKDAAHTGPNRSNPRKGKKYSSGKGRKIA